MASYGLGAAIGAGLRGYREGRDDRMRTDQANYSMQRQKVQDTRIDDEYAQNQADRTEFELPAKRMQMDAAKQQKERDRWNQELARAVAHDDETLVERIYNEGVPDGGTARLVRMPDGTIEIQHSNGKRAIAANVEELAYGKPDGSGFGVFQMLNPDGVASSRADRAKRTAAREDKEFEYGLRATENTQQHKNQLAQIGAQGAQSRELAAMNREQTFTGEDGNLYTMQPGGAVAPVMGPGGTPMRAKYGVGGGRGGGVGGQQDTAFIRNIRYRAERAKQADPALADIPQETIEYMVMEMESAGKDHASQQKIASQLLRQSLQGMGAYMTPEELAPKVQALQRILDDVVGPSPTMGGQAPGSVPPVSADEWLQQFDAGIR